MKGLSYSLLRAACALVIGLVLVLFPDQAAQYLVITVGCVFLVPAFVSIVAHFARPAAQRHGFPLLGIGSFLFGLWLVIAPAFFADLLTYVLGFILLMGGVQQIAALSAGTFFQVEKMAVRTMMSPTTMTPMRIAVEVNCSGIS